MSLAPHVRTFLGRLPNSCLDLFLPGPLHSAPYSCRPPSPTSSTSQSGVVMALDLRPQHALTSAPACPFAPPS